VGLEVSRHRPLVPARRPGRLPAPARREAGRADRRCSLEVSRLEGVFIFEPSKKKKLINQVEMEGLVRSPPVAAHGVFYLQTENRLYAIAHQ
jgi:hypothetical protein